jgi:hypothetical protein
VPGDLPTAVGYVNVAEMSWPLSEAVANAPATTLGLSRRAGAQDDAHASADGVAAPQSEDDEDAVRLDPGDVAFNHLGIETETEKPDSASRHEDRVAIAHELGWLHQAEQNGVSVVVSHDGDQLATFARHGILSEGLVAR